MVLAPRSPWPHRYLGLLGRLIYEFGGEGSGWETEVVAMLAEDRVALLGDDALGSKIVSSTLSQIEEEEPKMLFVAFAAAPEDVPIPMEAAELIWCSYQHILPPLSRLELMKLRRHLFALLDRNLLLGESITGVYMHDVVRDASRGMAGGDALQQHQRELVQLLHAATPAQGWPSVRAEPLGAYVLQSLRHHCKEALQKDPGTDEVALSWLETKDGFLLYTFNACIIASLYCIPRCIVYKIKKCNK